MKKIFWSVHTMKRIFLGLIFGLFFAILSGVVTTVWAQADSNSYPVLSTDLDCQGCHPAFVATWENSAHAQAMSNMVFLNAWHERQDEKECLVCHTTGYDPASNTWLVEGVSCQACHSPLTENHPKEPMPSDRSSELCGNCHTETVIAWQTSKHQNTGLSCIDCHGQHSTSLKAEDATSLCTNCHTEATTDYIHTSHSTDDASCADCHLELTNAQTGEGHAARNHTFNVKFGTCNACHNLDATAQQINAVAEKPLDAMAAVATLGVSLDPDPISPIYFVLLSALIGTAFGLILAPWIERWFRKMQLEVKVEK